ncbi:hypothetical protein J7E96_13420 [Streptomyces sp. ISL-96]|uniref:hypothetical protein n=1 Tax=Streptomyces sp. ISL-96 TaxID=2819191 RepID=UPI001BE7915B|nr:hypothetical protein [Streptomyces sp. ISL-96]MBT2489497.1 hypothetical protein [Streptomyces sp. ISL-96]
MSDLDFYAHVATRCDVLGTGIGSDRDGWEAAVGPDYLDDPGGGLLRRDYGLVEVTFAPRPQGPMSCVAFGVKTHRLLHGQSANVVPPPLSQEYGTFAPRVRHEELRAAIRSLGRTVELEDESSDVHRYRVPESGARIFVVADPDPYGHGDHRPDEPEERQVGDVWMLDVSPDWWGPQQRRRT